MQPTPLELLELGCSIIPVRADKKPALSWKQFQINRPTHEDLQRWSADLQPPAYAVITGAVSGRITFDFDGEKGVELARQWGIRPHRKTGGGGLHLDVVHPGWLVPTLNSRSDGSLGKLWPGLDVRGDGGYAVAVGRNEKGPYEWLRDPEPDPIDVVPAPVWDYLRKHSIDRPSPELPAREPARVDAGESARIDSERLIRRALEQASSDGRNNSGFWLAVQLRDNGFAESEAQAILSDYSSRVPGVNVKGERERYSEHEAMASVREAYSRSAREPWVRSDRPRRYAYANSPRSDDRNDDHESDSQPPNLLDYLFNDHGNAERLIALYGDDLNFCHAIGKWLVWDGMHWCVDETDQARRLAKQTMLAFLRQADKSGNEPAEKFARSSLEFRRITNMLSMAQHEIFVKPAELDENPYLLNFLNGTIDLRTGEVRPHDRADLITKLVHYEYRPDARCERWQAFLDQIMGGGPDAGEAALARALRLTEYLQRALGYSLTGCTREKAVFVVFGEGDNGKSTMLTTFRQLVEEYSVLLQADTLMVRQESNNTQADLADLRGARFVQTSETEEGQRLAQGKLKRITQGMGKIKAVRKYENPIEFTETHKLWLDTNRKPTITDADDRATFNRLHPIPFTMRIPKEQIDREMPAKLLQEAEGILAWAVAGAKLWYETSLDRPPEIDAAKDEWRVESDHLGRFIEERCIVTEGFSTQASVLYAEYKRWAESVGEHPMIGKSFGLKMPNRGFQKKETNRGIMYLGIGIRSTVEGG